MMLKEALQAEKRITEAVFILREQSSAPSKMEGPSWFPSDLSVPLSSWCEIQEAATCLSVQKDAPALAGVTQLLGHCPVH